MSDARFVESCRTCVFWTGRETDKFNECVQHEAPEATVRMGVFFPCPDGISYQMMPDGSQPDCKPALFTEPDFYCGSYQQRHER
tara:strand:+ start:557 stop:808 length:252 start_codon:yes stop_codon:yes gene_type:complete